MQNITPTPAPAPVSTACYTSNGITSGYFPTINLESCFDNISAYVAYLALYLCSWILGLVGLLFDTIMNYTVVGMKANLPGTVINAGWADIRDIGNLVFIFMAIYIGIKTIIGGTDGNTKKLIRNLILAALLVNFSLFFTQILIDASNILAISFYNLIVQGKTGVDAFTATFAGPLGLPSLWSFPGLSGTSQAISSLSSLGFLTIIVVGVGGSFFLLLTAVTFATAGVLFVIRFVVIIFLLILSPIAFLFAFLTPNLKDMANQWWKTLMGQLIFAPLYMILILLVAVLVTTGPKAGNLASALTTGVISGQATSTPSTSTAIASVSNAAGGGTAGTVSEILYFIVIIFLMNGATLIAVQWASKGQSLVGKAVNWAQDTVNKGFKKSTGYVSGGAVNIAGKAGRKYVGGGAALLQDRYGQAWQRGKAGNIIQRTASRAVSAGVKTVAEGSYDIRGTKTFQDLSKKVGVDLGEARGKGGYRAQIELEAKEMIKNVQEVGGATNPTRLRLEAANRSVSEARNALVDFSATTEKESLEEQAKIRQRISSRTDLNEKEKKDLIDAETRTFKASAADKKTKLEKNLRDAEKSVKDAEKARTSEQKTQQASYLVGNKSWSRTLGFVSGKHKASYEKAVEEFARGKKGEGEKEEQKIEIDQIASDLQNAIDADNTERIKEIIKGVSLSKIKKLPGRIVANEKVYIHLDPESRKAVKGADLTQEDREKMRKAEARMPTATATATAVIPTPLSGSTEPIGSEGHIG